MYVSRVVVIGMGGLGCPVALGLAERGVSDLRLVDPDCVELSNLPRQVLYTAADIGKPKVVVAQARLAALFPQTRVEFFQERLTSSNVAALFDGADVIVDGTDDPSTKFLINDRALATGQPCVLGGVARFQGLVLAVAGVHGPCYRCLFEQPPAPEESISCSEAGVLGPLPGVVGHLQAQRAWAMIQGEVAAQTGFVTTIDGLTGRIRDIPLPEGAHCSACGGLASRLDITTEHCPMTFVRTRIALEALEPGQSLDITMRLGEPSRNVPRNLVEEGYRVLTQGPLGGDLYRVVVRNHPSP